MPTLEIVIISTIQKFGIKIWKTVILLIATAPPCLQFLEGMWLSDGHAPTKPKLTFSALSYDFFVLLHCCCSTACLPYLLTWSLTCYQ